MWYTHARGKTVLMLLLSSEAEKAAQIQFLGDGYKNQNEISN